jgi:hypothetical protein
LLSSSLIMAGSDVLARGVKGVDLRVACPGPVAVTAVRSHMITGMSFSGGIFLTGVVTKVGAAGALTGSGGSSLPSRRARSDVMAASLSGGASWTPAIVCQLLSGLKDAIGCRDVWDRECMVLEAKRVGDAFAPSVSHDHSDAPVVICGIGKVPRFGGMVAP